MLNKIANQIKKVARRLGTKEGEKSIYLAKGQET